jgi:hypothetical protein
MADRNHLRRLALRTLDTLSLGAFLGLMITLGVRLWPAVHGAPMSLAALGMLAYVGADFASGLFHWIGDTWGSPDTAIVGTVFIRSFREHHLDPLAITRHDFVEVNGANCLVSLPFVLAAHCMPLTSTHPWTSACAAFTGMFLCAVFLTNQFHKWAHTERLPGLARVLQQSRLILSTEHHRRHHLPPYDTHYCITSGWLNGILHRVGFFCGLERLISRATGWTPRRD